MNLLACAVLMNGQPLTGAEVTFEPEPFLGEVIKPATGTTERTGIARMTIGGVTPPSMMVGYYKVRISKKDASGKELLPARYNSKSILGQEVAQDSRALAMGPIRFDLTGR